MARMSNTRFAIPLRKPHGTRTVQAMTNRHTAQLTLLLPLILAAVALALTLGGFSDGN
jgi:hypothetical protein